MSDDLGADLEISVVVPTYRRPARVARLIAALEEQTLSRDRFEVVVVDDCSDDNDTADVLRSSATSSPLTLRVLTTPVNGGPGAARNRGWRNALAPLVAFTDDDCVPAPEWLTAGLAALGRNDRLGVVQGLTLPPPGAEAGSHWAIVRKVTWESPWFEACNIFYRWKALAATSGFDERLRYGEDTAAGWAVVDAGWERDFAVDAVVFHDVEERGVRWRIGRAWLERNLVDLALDHPGLRRDAFWRPWAFRADGVALAIALLAAATARLHRLRLLGVIPYLAVRRLPLHRPGVAAGSVAVDVAQLAGHLVTSARRRRLVL